MSETRHALKRTQMRMPTIVHEVFDIKKLFDEMSNDLIEDAVVADVLHAHSSAEGVGTKKTGYALPELGPFLCCNCIHAHKQGTRCDHTEVIADEDVPKDDEQLAIIKPASCCNYFHPLDTK